MSQAALKEKDADDVAMIEAVREATVSELGYFLNPSELFHAIALKGSNQIDINNEGVGHNFILADLTKILKNIEQSTLETDSADDFRFSHPILSGGSIRFASSFSNSYCCRSMLLHQTLQPSFSRSLSDAYCDISYFLAYRSLTL